MIVVPYTVKMSGWNSWMIYKNCVYLKLKWNEITIFGEEAASAVAVFLWWGGGGVVGVL